jgi:hypothetical protein
MRLYQYLIVCLVPFPASAQNRSVWSHSSLPSTPTPAIPTSQALPTTTPQDAQPATPPPTPTSPTPYSNSRTNPGTVTSASPSAPYSNSRTNPGTATSTSPPSAIDACWTTPYCQAVLGDISYCYNTTGAMQDPNHNSVKDQAYQTCLCSVRGPAYKKYVRFQGRFPPSLPTSHISHEYVPSKNNMPLKPHQKHTLNLTQVFVHTYNKVNLYTSISSLPPTSTDAYPLNCFTCLSRAGLDTSSPTSATQLLKAKFSDFCNALPQNANLYDLLTYVLAWVQSAGSMADLPGDVLSVTQWKGRFTSTPGMNQPTT